ncbi:MAG: aspartyl-tRNA(Asn)/glutamyl-tRNA(Gln) amidotransferase subunit [Bryobacterales bacterium]|nr:aspartyl-tRNA(Asn)/glutamyl-tRNA(Gln) amidotransferase subunit [Bryobacterales bacterium]
MAQPLKSAEPDAPSAGEIHRRDFMRTAAGAAVLAAANRSSVFAAGSPESDALAKLTMAEASKKIHAREITCTQLTEACIQRSGVYNSKVNAYITLMHDEALAQAVQLDAEAKAGKFRSPLHGVPIALKDNIDTAGTRTTGGSAVFEDRYPDEDAEVVRRLKQAGAIILAKANLQEFAMGSTSVSTYFRPVRNPWALDRISAGSSGGSAAALISDMTIGALGTDTGGSVRMPASYCGIVGLKPTYGLVSIRGIIPRTYSLDHCGPMTKTVEDNAMLLNAMVGYDKYDVASVEHPKEDYVAALKQPVNVIRLGIPRAPFFDFLDDETGKAMEEAITVLGKLTRSVKDMHLPPPGKYSRAYFDGEIEAFHWEWYQRKSGSYSLNQRRTIESVHKRLNDVASENCSARVVDYINAQWELQRLRKTIDDSFVNYDLVALPTMRVLPGTINDALAREENVGTGSEPSETSNCVPFNTFGIPAVSIPCGFSASGLPVGLMIVGPRFSEGKVLALANAYEKATQWHTRRPKLMPDMPVPPVTRKTGAGSAG